MSGSQSHRQAFRAFAIATLAALCLSACSSSNNGRMALVESLLFSSPSADYPRTQAEIAAYPYAQLGVRYGDARPGIAVLAEYVDGNHLWVASDQFTLLTTPAGRILNLQVNGRFWRTAPLSPDPLQRTDIAEGFSLVYSRPIQTGHAATNAGAQKPMQLQCELTLLGGDLIAIKGKTYQTNRWLERCDSSGESSELNIWVDEKQRLRRLEGQLGFGAQSLRLDMLKVPA